MAYLPLILDSLGLQQTYEKLVGSPTVKAGLASLRRLGEHIYSKAVLLGKTGSRSKGFWGYIRGQVRISGVGLLLLWADNRLPLEQCCHIAVVIGQAGHTDL